MDWPVTIRLSVRFPRWVWWLLGSRWSGAMEWTLAVDGQLLTPREVKLEDGELTVSYRIEP